eukprot:IDg3172t1
MWMGIKDVFGCLQPAECSRLFMARAMKICLICVNDKGSTVPLLFDAFSDKHLCRT